MISNLMYGTNIPSNYYHTIVLDSGYKAATRTHSGYLFLQDPGQFGYYFRLCWCIFHVGYPKILFIYLPRPIKYIQFKLKAGCSNEMPLRIIRRQSQSWRALPSACVPTTDYIDLSNFSLLYVIWTFNIWYINHVK